LVFDKQDENVLEIELKLEIFETVRDRHPCDPEVLIV
jgi:hypothetical protein